MPPAAKRTVPQINQEVIRRYYAKLPNPGAPYYVHEKGRSAIRWCCLRIIREKIQIGLRKGQQWLPVATLPRNASPEEIEALRGACRRKARELEDEDGEPSLRMGRLMSWAQAWDWFRQDYVERRSSRRSGRTLDWYTDLFECHVLPLFGGQTLAAFSALSLSEIDAIPLRVAARVQSSRPWASGRHTGNAVLRAMRMVWDRCRRRGWILKDPFADALELEVKGAADVFLEDADLTAIGAALRNLESLASQGSAASRQVPSLAALSAVRIVLYTGCRHIEELLRGKLSWIRTDYGIPRIEVPRAKGQRQGKEGRIVYLGPEALRHVLAIPRPGGCEDLVPGRRAQTQMARLTETWERVILEARKILESSPTDAPSTIRRARIVGYEGEKRVTLWPGSVRVPVKVTRHTVKTIHPRAGIAADHSRQLLGHEAASLGDRVYLHQHGPSLAEAAKKAESYIRQIMGDIQPDAARRLRLVNRALGASS
jgi:hypothetical protein